MLDPETETGLRLRVSDVHVVGAAMAGIYDGREFAITWMHSARSSGPRVFMHRDDDAWIEVSVDLDESPYMVQLIEASLALRRHTLDQVAPAADASKRSSDS